MTTTTSTRPGRVLTAVLGGALAALTAGCFEDTSSATDESADGGTGCAECDPGDVGPFGCECRLGNNGSWSPLGGQDFCLDPQFDETTKCTSECQSAHSNNPNYQGRPATDACSNGDSYNCTNWNPASHISVVFGVYQVNAAWLATLVANPTPLWACDDAELHPSSDHTRFVVTNLNSGEFLYEIGLRNNDKIMSLNGIALSSFSAGFTAYALYLNGTTAYTLSVLRGTNTISISISLV